MINSYPQSEAREVSSCSGSIDAGEARGIQGVLSQSKDLDIQINLLSFEKPAQAKKAPCWIGLS